MKITTKLFFLIGIVLLILVSPGSAEVLHPEMVDLNKTMTYADLGLTGAQDVQIWVGNTLVETGNTTAGYLYQPIGDYSVVIKPSLISRWASNPANILTDAVNYLLTFALPLFVILGFAAIIIGLYHKGRR